MVLSLARSELSDELISRIRPVTLASEKLLEVPEPLLPLFPWGGLARGTTVGFGGVGGWSLAMALLGTSLGAEGWVSVVGVPTFNLVAAADYGLRLDRVLVVTDPGPSRWGSVVSSLLEATDVVVVNPTRRVGQRDARRLGARIRDHESVLFCLDGGRGWPTGLDSNFSVAPQGWEGLGEGHGYLRGRRADVAATGRRSGGGRRSVSVWLPNSEGRLAALERAEADPAGGFTPRLVG